MLTKPYLTGRWAIYKTQGTHEVLGYIVDGTGLSTVSGRPPFRVENEALFDPEGKRLGHLAPLGDSWAVNHGNNDIGHVLQLA